METIFVCSLIGCAIGAGIGTVSHLTKQHKQKLLKTFAAYPNILTDLGLCQLLMTLLPYADCNPEAFRVICEYSDKLSNIHGLTLNKNIKFNYGWKCNAYIYQKRIFDAMGTLSKSISQYNKSKLSRKHGQDKSKSALEETKSMADFGQYANALVVTIKNYYDNIMLSS